MTYRFPRRSFSSKLDSNAMLQLHGFSDASQNGLGFAIYVRLIIPRWFGWIIIDFRTSLGGTDSSPSKPTKKGLLREISIPRLELHATSLMAKAISQLKEFLQTPIESIQLWTDLSTVVQWLKLKETKEVFIRNRLPVIRSYCIKHVSTKENPADLASRGVEPQKLRSLPFWWHGPSWLQKDEICWPKVEFVALGKKIALGKKQKLHSLPFWWHCPSWLQNDEICWPKVEFVALGKKIYPKVNLLMRLNAASR